MTAAAIMPADASARARVADELAATLFVGAGAGTGKTTALVGRIVRLAITGTASLRGIAAITFTEAAAAELRDRVREALERTAAGETVTGAGPGGLALHPDAADRQRAATALRELDQATLTTLHGFAQRILLAHAIEAGLPPRIQVQGQQASIVAFRQRWEHLRDTLLDDPAVEEVLLRGIRCGISLRRLRDLASTFNDNWDLVAAHEPPDPGPLPPIDPGGLLDLLQRARDAEGRCTADDDKLLAHLQGLHPFIDELTTTTESLAVLQLLGDAPTLTCKNGRADNWGGKDGKAEVVDLLHDAADEAARLRVSTGRDALARLLIELRRHTLAAAHQRRAAGTLEFHDLLVLARDLLRTSPEACARLRARFSHLLLDEFQDTDPIQAELALRIAGIGAPGDDWTSYVVEPGRLFFVGDPKQSIYRFRRASIELYLQVQGLVADEPVSLNTCFRSVPGIIDWVNAVFGPLFGDGRPGSQPPYEPMTGSRPAHPEHAAVLALGGPISPAAEGPKLTVGQVREVAADESVRLIRQAVADQWPTGDPGAERPLRFGDIAVLIPTRSHLPELEAALRGAHVPYRLESSSLIFSTPEVADLVAALRAVADPGDDLAVVAALRTPLYGCADDELVAWKLAGGRWNHADPGPGGTPGPVADALAHLADLHRRSRWESPSRLIERIIDDRLALALTLDTPRARDIWRRVRWLADQARVFTEGGGLDLRGWLDWLDILADDDAKTTEVAVDELDDDAVRILTMHRAKGLEFPLVVLAGLTQAERAEAGTRVLWGPHGPEARIDATLATPGFAALDEHEARCIADESVRRFYVAATRARDYLVVPLHHIEGTDTTVAARLWERRAELDDTWVHVEPTTEASLPSLIPTPAAPPPEPIDGTAARDAWAAAHRSLLAQAARPRAIAPTALAAELDTHGATAPTARRDDPERAPDTDLPPEPPEHDTNAAAPRGRGGTELGRAVHGVLQLVDPADLHTLDALARVQASAEGIGHRADEVARLARHALASPAVAAAARHAHWRELYVAAPIGDRLLEGFVDLLVEGPDGYTVVDYKTALGATDAQLDERAAAYRLQAVAYALAVQTLTGRPVRRAVFVFLRADGAAEREVPQLAQAIDDLAHQLRTSASA